MNRFVTLFLLVILISLSAFAQQWRYVRELKFPPADTGKVQPYLCAVDETGRLYVATSKATTLNSRNAIFFADSTDTQFKKMIDFDDNGDSDTLVGNVGSIRGIATVKRDVFITSYIPYPRTKPNTVSSLYVYRNGDTTLVDRFGFNIVGSGYGTYLNGLALTKDTMAISGISFGNGPRWYNFGFAVTTPARGSYVPPPTPPLEPGGLANAGFDVIRDLAVQPEGDYKNSQTPFYTSRNSDRNASTGGIAVWTGGTDALVDQYVGLRVIDASGALAFGSAIPYGITMDHQNRLWVAGIDSTRRWVKCFDVSLPGFAIELFELPGQNSVLTPDPQGAPMQGPTDVAVIKDNRVAYVIDYLTRSAFVFTSDPPTSVKDGRNVPMEFALEQNFPNPFNPSTSIPFTVGQGGYARLAVSNSLGQEVALLQDGIVSSGKHVRVFNADNLPSGIYFYTLTSGSGSMSRKMMLLK